MVEQVRHVINSRNSKNIRSGLLMGLAFLVGISRFPALGGEDIEQARANYLGAKPLDFWGGISTLFYGNFPSMFGLNWESSLVISQILVTLTGLLLINTRNIQGSRVQFSIFLAVSYFCLVFSSYGTRDGTLFSCLVLGISLISGKGNRQTQIDRKRIILGASFLVLGLSFRPWVSICLLPPLLYFLRQSSKKSCILKDKTAILLSLCLTVGPISLEVFVNKSLDLKHSYPQQQVMIMDLTSNYCWGTQRSSNLISREALRAFTGDNRMDSTICQFFRSDTWVSLTNNGNASSNGLQSHFQLIAPSQKVLYESVFHAWLKIILKDPVTYIQNKTIFATKVLIASDTRGLRVTQANSPQAFIQGLILLPYDLAITIHLMSIGTVAFFLLVAFCFSRTRSKSVARIGLLMCMLWLIMTTVAYIGSNGRYTYTVSLLAILLLFCSRELECSDAQDK